MRYNTLKGVKRMRNFKKRTRIILAVLAAVVLAAIILIIFAAAGAFGSAPDNAPIQATVSYEGKTTKIELGDNTNIPYVELGSTVSLSFRDGRPASVSVIEVIAKADGSRKYGERIEKTLDLTYSGGKLAVFSVERNFGDSLSSYSGDYLPGKSFRWYRIICNYDGESVTEYGLWLRTDPAIIFSEASDPPASSFTLPSPSTAVSVTPAPAAEASAPESAQTSPEPFVYNGFVDVSEYDPRLIIDLRYATTNNFTGKQLYPFALALLRAEAAELLKTAQDAAYKDGRRIVIFDAYRPLSVQQSLYDAAPENLKAYVAKPSARAPHGIGLTVDCGLSDLDGNLLDMPSEFDAFDKSASISYTGGTAKQRENRDYLIRLMSDCGFSVYSEEWWHYSAPNPKGYEALDFSFEDFSAAARTK
jgi:D-alanyl-D-alanine dipeptidase